MSSFLPVANKTVVIGSSDFQSLLDGVKLVYVGLTKKEDTENTPKSADKQCLLGLHCTTCQIAFELSEEYRAHYKSEWHRYNLKQKIRNRHTIDEPKFLALESKANDSSSSSESDDEINDYNSYFSIDSRLFFENNSGNTFSIYRCLVTNLKEIPKEDIIVHSLKSISFKSNWFIVMLGGGRFSAAVFKGDEAVVHKTFHSYTVRAKQGGSQSTQDRSKGGGSKSAGSNLRRHNEASQLKHVQEILTSWKQHIKFCDFIFYRATGPNNRNILFGGPNPLIDKTDSRLCPIPFGTKKATYSEVQKVRNQLSTVLVYDSKEVVNNSIQNYVQKLFKKRKNREPIVNQKEKTFEKPIENNLNQINDKNIQSSSISDLSEDNVEPPQNEVLCENNRNILSDEIKNKKRKKRKRKPLTKKETLTTKCTEVEEVKNLLVQAIEKNDAVTLNKYLSMELNSNISEEHLESSLNEAIDEKNNTVLHLAATKSLHDHIYLLLKFGSNPIHKNKDAKTPYEVAPDKSTRKVFRKFMAAFPDKYNYDKARLPGPLTEDLQEELKERKKAKQKRAKERKVIEELKKEEEIENQKFLQLSDREKRAIAAEKRFMAAQGIFKAMRCFYCGKNIEEKFPFEYMDYKLCSIQCVKNHRQKNSTN